MARWPLPFADLPGPLVTISRAGPSISGSASTRGRNAPHVLAGLCVGPSPGASGRSVAHGDESDRFTAESIRRTISRIVNQRVPDANFALTIVLSAKIEATRAPEPDRRVHDAAGEKSALLLVLRQDAA